jgi:hypothetical protein
MFVCDNSDCKVWLHSDCIIDSVLSETYKRLVTAEDDENPEPDSSTNGTASKATGKKGKASQHAYDGKFEATIIEEDGKPTLVEITDLRPEAPLSFVILSPTSEVALFKGWSSAAKL